MKLLSIVLIFSLLSVVRGCSEYASCGTEEEALTLFDTQLEAKKEVDTSLITIVYAVFGMKSSALTALGGL